jgi:hypothetical protein
MKKLTYLPDEIVLPTGEVLKPVIGGHLDGKPFLTVQNTGLDISKNGWSNQLKGPDFFEGGERDAIIKEAKARGGLKYRQVAVCSRRLRRAIDLHGRPYPYSKWVFVEVR